MMVFAVDGKPSESSPGKHILEDLEGSGQLGPVIEALADNFYDARLMLNANLRNPKYIDLWDALQLMSRIAVFRTEWDTHDIGKCYSDTFSPKLEARIRSYIAAYLQQPSSPGKNITTVQLSHTDHILLSADGPTAIFNWESDEMLKQASWALETVIENRRTHETYEWDSNETEWQAITPEKQSKPRISASAQGYFNQLQGTDSDSDSDSQ